MITREEVIKLANLSRLKLSDDEISKMQTDMSAILAYVDKLREAKGVTEGPSMSFNKNIMREDRDAHEGGLYTDKLIALAPKKQISKDGKFVKVKKILGGSE